MKVAALPRKGSLMKLIKTVFALLLVLCFALPIQVSASSSALNELEAAQQLAQLLRSGSTEMTANVRTGFSFTLCLEYTRMLWPDYYGLTWSLHGNKASFRVDMPEPEKHRKAWEEAVSLAGQLKKQSTSEEQLLRAFHDELIERCEYDYEAYLNMEIAGPEPFSAYGALLGGHAVCDGYSSAFAMLCAAADIPCIFVPSKDMNHSWNAVFTDGQILFVDVTYDDQGQGKAPSYDNFLKTKTEFAVSHKGWDSAQFSIVSSAVWPENYASARALYRLGLFKGTDKGFELTRQPRRDEAAVMLTRLLGLESQAQAMSGASLPFDDVSAFYRPYVALLYEKGLTTGTSLKNRTYSPAAPITAQQYMTFMLRSLGYSDASGDFSWNSALEKAVSLGILTHSEMTQVQQKAFTRGTMALLSVRTLQAQTKQGQPMVQQLVGAGVIDAALAKEVL